MEEHSSALWQLYFTLVWINKMQIYLIYLSNKNSVLLLFFRCWSNMNTDERCIFTLSEMSQRRSLRRHLSATSSLPSTSIISDLLYTRRLSSLRLSHITWTWPWIAQGNLSNQHNPHTHIHFKFTQGKPWTNASFAVVLRVRVCVCPAINKQQQATWFSSNFLLTFFFLFSFSLTNAWEL